MNIYKITLPVLIMASLAGCSKKSATEETGTVVTATYKGTGSVTQGKGTTTTTNVFPGCSGSRVAPLGTIMSTDSKSWILPGEVNFTNSTFPFASDLNNSCAIHDYTTSAQAVGALNASNVVTVDSDGTIVTAYIFADNYFEMYVNGIPVGKDPVPYTPFNSSIVQFKVKKPYTVAIKLVDWEENLGLASENNGGNAYYPGDGGLVAVFKNAAGGIDGITNNTWKAQTFYTGPIKDLGCLVEAGTTRSSSGCNTAASADGTKYYGIHWDLPSTWFAKTFDDSTWPSATVYATSSVGVDNKPPYTNFTNIWDDSSANADFIWSTNLILIMWWWLGKRYSN